jgi:hypothetical protein
MNMNRNMFIIMIMNTDMVMDIGTDTGPLKVHLLVTFVFWFLYV